MSPAGPSRDRFDHRLARRLGSAKHLTLLLDFDGTLAPIRRRPREVLLDRSTRDVVRKLAAHRQASLWILSGRRRRDVQRRAGVRGIHYLGLHGWEGPRTRGLPRATQEAIRAAKRLFAEHLDGTPNLWIENKGPVFVIHYRGAAPADVRRASAKVRSLMKRFEPRLRMMPGKKIWEIMPREIGSKADAVREIVAREPRESMVIYAGDDTTDEEAFRALPRAITIHVGSSRRTSARFRLASSSAMRRLLQKLEESLCEKASRTSKKAMRAPKTAQ